jgi:1,4-alpha-glucan branching enzyme
LGVPKGGPFIELLNTDADCYAGSGVGNAGRVDAEMHEAHGRPYSLVLDLPPLGTLVLKPLTAAVTQQVAPEQAAELTAPEETQAEATDDRNATDPAG